MPLTEGAWIDLRSAWWPGADVLFERSAADRPRIGIQFRPLGVR